MNIFQLASDFFDVLQNVVGQISTALFTNASEYLSKIELPGLFDDLLKGLIELIGDFSLLELFVRFAVVCIVLTFLYRLIGRY